MFIRALYATCEKRMSLVALADNENIIRTIQLDGVMRQRWERYCKENFYAAGIVFDEVISVLMDIGKNV